MGHGKESAFNSDSWDECKVVPVIQDEQSPKKRLHCLKWFASTIVGILVFFFVLLSKASFLLLVTFGHNETVIVCPDQKPTALLGIGFVLVAPNVLLLLKSLWKFFFKSAAMPKKEKLLWVLFVEFLVAFGAAILAIVAMPNFDIITNVMILNSVSILSAVLQVVAHWKEKIDKENMPLLSVSVCSIFFIILGYVLFMINYLLFEKSIQIKVSVGLAILGTILVSVNWWENYKISFLNDSSEDTDKSHNVVCILSSLMRIIVTSAVVGGYYPLSGQTWKSENMDFKPVVIAAVVIQIVSSALCHWFVVVACKMHALRRSFVAMYLASITVLAVVFIPYAVGFSDKGEKWSCSKTPEVEATLEWSKLLLADVVNTLNKRDIVVNNSTAGKVCLGCSAFFWWLGLIFSTVYIWTRKIHRIERTQDLFVRRMYEGAFLDQSMLLNTRFQVIKKAQPETTQNTEKIKVFLCATMWHETYDEMMKMIISMFRLDKYKPKKEKNQKNSQDESDVEFESHIYFDDAFKGTDNKGKRQANEYAEMLVDVVKEVYTIFSPKSAKQQEKDQMIKVTPYGGRLVYTLPYGNRMIVHLKNKEDIRHKKRWSQIMYLYYILGWKLKKGLWKETGGQTRLYEEKLKKEKRNTYILALDGDTDFQPAAVMLLIDRLKLYPEVGAACGRIHPTGTGPMVWYQKFEYAVGHWLQKTAEHVFGCVLCSPGCFSLFRGAALMDDNVMKRYTTKASDASQYVQYDQGEDRWLCTLLLQQGWRVEYNAASDAYTNAPQDFKEFYNQRRRWGPSTMANTIDLLGTAGLTSRRNPSFSKPYILYQIVSMAASVLGPATICLMLSGSFVFLFKMDANLALALAIVPPSIYLILCFKLKADTQITIAAVMSVFYAFLMAGTVLSICGDLVKEATFMTPSGLFLIGMVAIYIFTAVLHPQEFSLVIYGLLYIICIPSGYLLLVIYSIVNMNNVSWGTRESGGPAKTTTVNTLKDKILKLVKCPCLKSKEDTSNEIKLTENNLTTERNESTEKTEEKNSAENYKTINPLENAWIYQLQNRSSDLPLKTKKLKHHESEFWKKLLAKYLTPLEETKEQREKIANDLRELRNKVSFVFFFCNALWLVATFFLQAIGSTISIPIPKLYPNGTKDPGQTYYIDPIGLMFLLGFALLLLIQFVAMLYHRIYTLIHFVAYVDTEMGQQKTPNNEANEIQNHSTSTSSVISMDEFNI